MRYPTEEGSKFFPDVIPANWCTYCQSVTRKSGRGKKGGTNLEVVSDIDDKGIAAGLDGDPFLVFAHLQASHLALVQQGERVGVRVGAQPQRERWRGAGRVVVEASDRLAGLHVLAERVRWHPQPYSTQLQG